MLSDFNQTLRDLIYARARIDPLDVEISFDAPTREWVGARTKPTVNLFLYDLEENTELRRNGLETLPVRGVGADARGVKRLPPRRFDLNYMVSAISTVVEDEHHLLWRVMSALLRNPTLPEEFIGDNIKRLEVELHGRVSQPDDGPRPVDLWNSLETAPRPSLLYILTVPVDLETEFTAPLVLTRTLRYQTPEGTIVEAIHHIGGRVVDKLGAPQAGVEVRYGATRLTTDMNGRFVLVGVPEGQARIEITAPGKKARNVTLEVPSEQYDVTLE